MQTSDWQAADAGPFAVRLPAGYQRRDVQGIDSFVGEWVAPGRRVSFDFGPYSGLRDLRVLLDTAGAEAARQVLQAERLCRLEASGQTVVVVYRRDPDGTRRWEAGWLNPAGPNRDLSLGVQASDPAAEGEALAILRSVHLKER